jgi:small basic protein
MTRRLIWIPLVAFVVGFAGVLLLPRDVFISHVPLEWGNYLALATLAGFDAVFGGVRAGIEGKFRTAIFVTGFLVNMALAVLLALWGDAIGLSEMYLAAVVALGGRIFLNLSVIRRHWVERVFGRAS